MYRYCIFNYSELKIIVWYFWQIFAPTQQRSCSCMKLFFHRWCEYSSTSQPWWFQKSVLRVPCITLADSHQSGKRFQGRQELKVIMEPGYFLSFSFLTTCNGSNVFFSSLYPCIPIPPVFHITLLSLLSPWVMLNTLFPVLIGVASSHLFKVLLLWLESLQADSREFCRLAGK